jgi:hypothetical protein
MFKPFLFLGAAVAAVVLPSTAPNPSQVSIQSISYGGTGCPTGSVGQFLSSDLSTYVLFL